MYDSGVIASAMVLRWTPEPADLQETVELAGRLRGGVTGRPALAVAVVLAVVGAVHIAIGAWWTAGAVLVLIPVTMFAHRPVTRRTLWRSLPLARQPVEVVVAPDELRWTSSGVGSYTSSWQWSSFWYAVETERLFVLVGRPGERKRETLTSYLPKRAVADPAAMRALLGSVLPGGVRPA